MILPAAIDAGGSLCTWLCSPDGPDTPFATPLLAAADGARVLCLFVGLLVGFATPGAIARCRTSGQHARFSALAIYALVAVTTELEHLGDHPSYRLLLNLLATALAAYGMWRFQREVPTRPGRGTYAPLA